MTNMFNAENLSLHYRTRFGQEIYAVDDVSFSLNEGEVLGIAGESGCGKSTLVKGCMGLFMPPLHLTSGDIQVAGNSIVGYSNEKLRRDILGMRISMIPQGAMNALNPTRKIRDLATDMVKSHKPEMKKEEVYGLLKERFQLIGLDADRVMGAYPVELSGGMKQRVVIGTSTLLDPELVIADEPTSALDVSTQKSVIELLFKLIDAGIIKSMIFITHELPLLKHVADKIAVMYAGEFVEAGETESVLFDSRHPYTKALMNSMMLAEDVDIDKKIVALEGAPPKLDRPPQGCRFTERCPVAQSDCGSTLQKMRTVAGREVRCKYAE